jgi:DNA polymerase-4
MRVAADLQRKRYTGKTIGVKLRFEDFRTVTRDITLAQPTSDPAAIRRAAGQCLKRIELSRRIRLLGVRVGALVRSAAGAAAGPPTGSGKEGGPSG